MFPSAFCTSHLQPLLPHLRGRAFQFQCPAMSPTPRGQTRGQNFTLCPALRKRKSPWGKNPNFKTLSFTMHCGDSPAFSPGYPPPFPVGGGGGQRLQMTGALIRDTLTPPSYGNGTRYRSRAKFRIGPADLMLNRWSTMKNSCH